jgi:hypothetical protein
VDANASVPTSEAFRDYSAWATTEEVGWELKKLAFRRHLADRGFAAKKAAQGQRVILGLQLKSSSPRPSNGSNVIGKLDDGRIIRDDGISEDPIEDELNAHAARAAQRSTQASRALQ